MKIDSPENKSNIKNLGNDLCLSYLRKNGKKERQISKQKLQFVLSPDKPFSRPLTEGTLLLDKVDVIGWYLYLVEMYLFDPHRYEYFQGARVIPIFEQIELHLNELKNVDNINKRIRELLKKRSSETDALLLLNLHIVFCLVSQCYAM